MTDVILTAIILLPLACAYFFKSNGALAFFSVCAGFVLVSLASADIGNLLHRTNLTNLSLESTNLLLIFTPLLITLLLARGHIGGQANMVLSLVAAFCAGALAALISAPFFGSALPMNLTDNQLWNNLHKIQSWIISTGALTSFILIWMGGKNLKHRK